MIQAVRTVSTIVQFLERKFDFNSEDGQEMLEEAKEACKLLEKEIEILFPKK
jgi:hypothetical protein